MGCTSTILIVEDHDTLRAALACWLASRLPGHDLLEASSGEEALHIIAAQGPDIVLMDVELPGMNGIEATRRARALAPAVRVVMLTSREDRELQEAASRAGACAYVFKRRIEAELVGLLQRLVRTREQPQ